MKRAISIKLDIELWKKFKKYCIDKDITMSEKIEKLIITELNKNESKK